MAISTKRQKENFLYVPLLELVLPIRIACEIISCLRLLLAFKVFGKQRYLTCPEQKDCSASVLLTLAGGCFYGIP